MHDRGPRTWGPRAVLIAAVVASGSLAGPAAAASKGEVAGPPTSRVIVVYRDGVDAPERATRSREQRDGFRARHTFSHALHGFAASVTGPQAARLRRDPAVAFVAPDTPVRAAGGPLADGETVPSSVARLGFVSGGMVRGASTAGVAILDTGVDLTHPDLDAAHGINCVSPGGSSGDDNGHGTHVAGIVGARNDGQGVVGIAPGTRLWSVKVLGSTGTGSASTIICGLDWVTANAAALGIGVANLSLTGSGSSDTACGTVNNDPLHQAICRVATAGVTPVAAAGNAAKPLRSFRPAGYTEVLTVTATSDSDGMPGGLGGAPSCRASDPDDGPAPYSNYGGAVDLPHLLSAPGSCVRSDAPGGGTVVLSGTSMAAPAVAGAVALCIGEDAAPGACAGQAPADVIRIMRNAAEENATLNGGFIGDPNRAVAGRFYGFAVSPDPSPPSPPCTIVGTAGADILAGTPGDDVICGLGGNDTLTGAAGDDVLVGGDGNDALTGGPGDDLERGGAGTDQFVQEAAANGADVLIGGTGVDTANYSKRKAVVTVTLDDAAGDGALGEGDDVGSDVDNVTGGTMADLLGGGLGVNKLTGGGGNDRLAGSAGNDVLTGGGGADQVLGEAGDDQLNTLDNVTGNDSGDGGAGSDRCTADAGDLVAGCES